MCSAHCCHWCRCTPHSPRQLLLLLHEPLHATLDGRTARGHRHFIYQLPPTLESLGLQRTTATRTFRPPEHCDRADGGVLDADVVAAFEHKLPPPCSCRRSAARPQVTPSPRRRERAPGDGARRTASWRCRRSLQRPHSTALRHRARPARRDAHRAVAARDGESCDAARCRRCALAIAAALGAARSQLSPLPSRLGPVVLFAGTVACSYPIATAGATQRADLRSPSVASVIYSTAPAFNALIAFVLLGQGLTPPPRRRPHDGRHAERPRVARPVSFFLANFRRYLTAPSCRRDALHDVVQVRRRRPCRRGVDGRKRLRPVPPSAATASPGGGRAESPPTRSAAASARRAPVHLVEGAVAKRQRHQPRRRRRARRRGGRRRGPL